MKIKERFPLRFIRPTHRDWDRVNLDTVWWDHPHPVCSVTIAELVGVQAYVTIKGVADADETSVRPIYVVEIAGVKYIRDGHHRVTRALKRGHKTVIAELLTLSKRRI